jgi:hypothetical protein
MPHDWMLVETLGDEPAVVAEGTEIRDLVPIGSALRRSPHLMAIQTAIGETVRGGTALSSITPKHQHVIRTEVVAMSDGRIHGVLIWVGSPDDEPPPPPMVGALVWDLTEGTATDTVESLRVGGWDPATQPTHGRAFADDLPRRALQPNEAKVLSVVIKPEVGVTICDTWQVSDHQGQPITIAFCARSLAETRDDGTDAVVCRAMNWRVPHTEPATPDLAQRILQGLAEPGVHRALVDPAHWKLLKWLDDPAPFFDWRAGMVAAHAVHPDDRAVMVQMARQFETGPAAGVMRMVGHDGGWTPVHVTVHRIDLGDGVEAGLAVLRQVRDGER